MLKNVYDMKQNISKNIKAVIFDLGQVLIDLTPSRCMESFEKLGATGIEKKLASPEIIQFLESFELGNVSVQEFCNKMKEYIDLPVTDEQVIGAWNTFLGKIPSYKLDTILELHKEYKVYLLSNTSVLHWEYACDHYFNVYKGHRLSDFFDHAYTSFDLHLLKPDKAIYQTVLDETGMQPHEVFFLDDREDNCRSAREMGINVYQVTPGEDWRYLFR